MISVTRSNDCGNSPKNNYVEKFILALLTKEFDDVKNLSKVEATFIIQYENKLRKVKNLDEFKMLLPDKIQKIEFQHSISHGKVGASWGSFESNNYTHIFSTNIEFNNVKLSTPTVIQIFISAPS